MRLPQEVHYDEIVTTFTEQLKQTNTVRTKYLLYKYWVPFDCQPSSTGWRSHPLLGVTPYWEAGVSQASGLQACAATVIASQPLSPVIYFFWGVN